MRERKTKVSLWVFPSDLEMLRDLVRQLQRRYPDLVVTVADGFHEAVLALAALTKDQPKPKG